MSFPVFRILSYILGIVGTSLALPFAAALLWDGLRPALAFGVPMAAGWLAALACALAGRRGGGLQLDVRNAFMTVGGAWIAIGVFGALPLYLSGAFPSFVDAVFESVSGFTTTGATVAADVEALPHSVNLWRCQTHWLGGMGVIALAVALIPLLGVGGFRMIKAEATGPEKGKVTARITNTAKVLWAVYSGLTLLQAVLLHACGMGWFDAVCHAFSTLGTGGFSTRNASVGAFSSPAIEWICTVFMLLASVNFALYYQLLKGRVGDVFRDSELRTFVGLALGAIWVTTAVQSVGYSSLSEALRYSAFQVASIMSTTGFMTADYAGWHPSAQLVLFVLFFVGGCSGSTAGGVKVIRWTVLWKQLENEFRRILHPHGVFTMRINGLAGRGEFVPLVASFLFVYLLLVLLTSFVGTLAGLDLVTAFTGALSMVGNVGPAFGALGPTENCGALHPALKCWYAFAMLAGRLEIYTLLILLGGLFHRRVPNRRV